VSAGVVKPRIPFTTPLAARAPLLGEEGRKGAVDQLPIHFVTRSKLYSCNNALAHGVIVFHLRSSAYPSKGY